MADDHKQSLADILAHRQQPTGGLNALSTFLASGPYPVVGQWFQKKRLPLDGYTFTRCHFDECEFYVAKGNFYFDHCKLTGCSVLFDKDAFNIVQFYAIWMQEPWEKWQNLTPLIDENDLTYTFRRPS